MLKSKWVQSGKKYHTTILEEYNLSNYAFYATLKDMFNADPVIRKTTVVYKISDLKGAPTKPKVTSETVSKPVAKATENKPVVKATENKPVAKTDGVVHYEGMSVNKFLKANPSIRVYEDLRKYYSDELLKKAQYNGVFEVRRGKIIY